MIRLMIALFLLPAGLSAQGEYILSLPVSTEILKKNKVAAVYVHENMDSMMVQTNTYSVDPDGLVMEHYYYDPANEGGGPFDIEMCRRSKDTVGYVHYTRGMYGEDGSLINLLADHQYFYSSTGKLKKMIYHDYMDYQTLRMSIFDTVNPDFVDKTEWRLLNDDTLYVLRDFKNDKTAEHILKNKVNGKWVETEKGISTFKNGELATYVLYKNGKVFQEYNAEDGTHEKGKDEVEGDIGLPVADPFIETVYSDKADLIFKSDAKVKVAKFRLVLHYESGKGSDLTFYEVYDNQNELLLVKSDPAGEYRTEFRYNFRK